MRTTYIEKKKGKKKKEKRDKGDGELAKFFAIARTFLYRGDRHKLRATRTIQVAVLQSRFVNQELSSLLLPPYVHVLSTLVFQPAPLLLETYTRAHKGSADVYAAREGGVIIEKRV